VIYECGRVDVVDDEVEPAIVVEIAVRGAVRKTRTLSTPVFGLVGEREVPGVAKEIV